MAIRFPQLGAATVDVRTVRRYVRALFGEDHPRIDDIDLLTSEIVTRFSIPIPADRVEC